MRCHDCSNEADAGYECAMCGWIFCAGCVSLADHDPRCHVCLSIDSDPDIDEESQPGAAGGGDDPARPVAAVVDQMNSD
jgi:hypothetical protein